jgi:hypothetical protein
MNNDIERIDWWGKEKPKQTRVGTSEGHKIHAQIEFPPLKMNFKSQAGVEMFGAKAFLAYPFKEW